MTKSTPPKPGTEISVKWNELGPRVKVNGSNAELLITLAVINGHLAKCCDFSAETLRAAAEIGPELFARVCGGSVVVDMEELKRQAKEESHEDP